MLGVDWTASKYVIRYPPLLDQIYNVLFASSFFLFISFSLDH